MANNNTEYIYSNNENYGNNGSNSNNESKKTLRDFVEEGNLEKVKEILASNSQKSEVAFLKEKASLVHVATRKAVSPDENNSKRRRYHEILKELLKAGFHANEVVALGLDTTPLNMWASFAQKDAEEVLKTLVEYGANIDGIKTSAVRTKKPILSAIKDKNPITFNILLSEPYNLDPNKEYQHGMPLLHTAIVKEWPEGVEILLKKGANVEIRDSYIFKDNSIMAALRLSPSPKKERILDLLLAQPKINAEFLNKDGQTALMVALGKGDIPVIFKLLEDPRFAATIMSVGTKAKETLATSLELLLTAESNPTLFEDVKQLITILLKKGASLDDVEIEGDPIFHYFIRKAEKKTIVFVFETLLKKETSFLEKRGGLMNAPPLIYAIGRGDLELVNYLVENGANVNDKIKYVPTPIEYAFATGNIPIIKYLLSKGAILQKYILHQILQDNSDSFELINILKEQGSDINERNEYGFTPLMIAAENGNEGGARILLELGADPNKTLKDGNPLTPTAYDMAMNIGVRLVIAQYIEKQGPRFLGFLDTDFLALEWVFSDKNYVICPFCFTTITHGGGCMYIFEHNCFATRKKLMNEGATNVPFIHEKLYNTFKDLEGKTTFCYHCNRAGYTWPVERGVAPGLNLVVHAHIKLGPAEPFKKPEKAPKTDFDPYNTKTCLHQGGGGPDEKYLRFQVLINFMCYLNENFVGKISNKRAHLLARELFWEAPLFDGLYLTERPFSYINPDKKIGDVYPEYKPFSSKQIVEKIKTDKKLFLLCEKPTEPLPFSGDEEVVNESEIEYPNIPRYGTNAVDLAPSQEGIDEGDTFCWYYKYVELNDTGHGDRRPLYRFRHRQGTNIKTIYDHGTKNPKELICATCLEDFLRANTLQNNRMVCFNEADCTGHFHPSELQGIVSDAFYEEYKAYYNRNPILFLHGGNRNQLQNYPPLFGKPEHIEQTSCSIRGGKRKRKTRKLRKSKKTRKAKRYGKTRR